MPLAPTENWARFPFVTVRLCGCADIDGGTWTVREPDEEACPAELVTVTVYEPVLLVWIFVNCSLEPVPPAIAVPPNFQMYVKGAVPDAVAVNVTLVPATAVWLSGE